MGGCSWEHDLQTRLPRRLVTSPAPARGWQWPTPALQQPISRLAMYLRARARLGLANQSFCGFDSTRLSLLALIRSSLLRLSICLVVLAVGIGCRRLVGRKRNFVSRGQRGFKG